MYEKGDVKLTIECEHPDCDGPMCETTLEYRTVYDSKGNHTAVRGAYLPHSCSEWVIGGPDEIRTFIADLQAALETLTRVHKQP